MPDLPESVSSVFRPIRTSLFRLSAAGSADWPARPEDLLNTLAAITGKVAGFGSLGDTWADTTTAHGRLMLTDLGGLAEFERELIRARTVKDGNAPRRAA
jgi:DNA invertase Pin-like site-specific DNA recombinase